MTTHTTATDGDHRYPFLLVLPTSEHLYVCLQLCSSVAQPTVIIAAYVNFRLLFNVFYQLGKFAFYWTLILFSLVDLMLDVIKFLMKIDRWI